MKVVYRPNFEMVLCGLFNGDLYTYRDKMIEINPFMLRATHINCIHQRSLISDTQVEFDAEPDVFVVELETLMIMDKMFLAGRCLGCGRIYYCELPIP